VKPPRPLVLFVAALGILTGSQGCSASGDVAMEDFARQYPAALCDLAYRCCSPADVDRLFPYTTAGGTADQCKELGRKDLTRLVEILQMRLPTMTCADLARARSESLDPPLECDQVFTIQGSQPLGARCGQPYDCAPGLACMQPAHDHPGVCRSLAEAPGSCPLSCPARTFCDSTTGGACVNGEPDGVPCQGDRRCASRVCWGYEPGVAQPGTCGLPAGTCALQ
jgi:hypothetical protein